MEVAGARTQRDSGSRREATFIYSNLCELKSCSWGNPMVVEGLTDMQLKECSLSPPKPSVGPTPPLQAGAWDLKHLGWIQHWAHWHGGIGARGTRLGWAILFLTGKQEGVASFGSPNGNG